MSQAKNLKTGLKIALAVLLFLGVGILIKFVPVRDIFGSVQGSIENLGWAGPIVMAGAYAAMTVLMIPGSVVTLAAGGLFGLWTGFLVVTVGANLGAIGAFFLARTLLRNKVEGWAQGRPTFRALDSAVGEQGFKIVFLARLSPVFPFTLLNYLLGLTAVKPAAYTLANLLGMMPGTFLYVYIGSLAGDTLGGQQGADGGPLGLIMKIAGIVATLAVTLVITKIARKALGEAIPSKPERKLADDPI